MGIAKHISARAVIQVFLTLLTLGSAITAFLFSLIFKDFVDKMDDNFTGDLVSENLPCIRNTLPECDNGKQDKCWDRCCPAGYECARSPVVGLYCRDGTVECGSKDWCRDFADIPGQCRTEICKADKMVERMTVWAFVMAGFGVLLDIIDVVIFFAAPDAVIFKSTVNVSSSCIKWIAFGIMVGAGGMDFTTELYDSGCYNKTGMQMTAKAGEMLQAYVITQVCSAIFSLVLAPISAYYGGKLVGVPYVKLQHIIARRQG